MSVLPFIFILYLQGCSTLWAGSYKGTSRKILLLIGIEDNATPEKDVQKNNKTPVAMTAQALPEKRLQTHLTRRANGLSLKM